MNTQQRIEQNRRFNINVVLTMLITVSAIVLIYVKHVGVQLVTQLDQNDKRQDALQQQWGQLLLEKGTLTSHGRIERIARQQLSMEFPKDRKLMRISRKQ